MHFFIAAKLRKNDESIAGTAWRLQAIHGDNAGMKRSHFSADLRSVDSGLYISDQIFHSGKNW